MSIDAATIRKNVERHVRVLAELIGPRHDQKPSTVEAARAHIRREWEQMGWDVAAERFQSLYAETQNLTIEQAGTMSPDNMIIVGAHYDTVPETPGADDNASAVAALLEVSRLLRGEKHAKTLRFVAFANEEPPHFYSGLMGSQIHAANCRKNKEKIDAMICFEMVGFFDDEKGSQTYPPGLPKVLTMCLPKRGNFLTLVANLQSWRILWPMWRGWRKATKLRLIPIALPQAIHEIRLSDHGPFWDEGFHAAMATDTSFFRNPHYHQSTDIADTLDYDRLTQVVFGMAAGISRLAGGKWRPASKD